MSTGRKRRVEKLSGHMYGRLNSLTRLRQVIEADVRGDPEEAVRIGQAAPRREYHLPDPHYAELMRTVLLLVQELANDIADLHADLKQLGKVRACCDLMLAVPGSRRPASRQQGTDEEDADDGTSADKLAWDILYHHAYLPRLKRARASLRAFTDACREGLALDPDKVIEAYLGEKKKDFLRECMNYAGEFDVDEREKSAYEDAMQRYETLLDFLVEPVQENDND